MVPWFYNLYNLFFEHKLGRQLLTQFCFRIPRTRVCFLWLVNSGCPGTVAAHISQCGLHVSGTQCHPRPPGSDLRGMGSLAGDVLSQNLGYVQTLRSLAASTRA